MWLGHSARGTAERETVGCRMNLYDGMLERIGGMLESFPAKAYAYDAGKLWPEHGDFHMMFQKDMAYELGGGRSYGVNLTCVTSDPRFFQEDQVLVYGPELSEISEGEEVSYARICEVLVRDEGAEPMVGNEIDGDTADGAAADASQNAQSNSDSLLHMGKGAAEESERLYKMLQDLDFVKYHVFPKGFMLRSSGQSHKEQARVGKDALREGVSFERIGNTIISHYKKLEPVMAVRILFITERQADFEKLQKEAVLASEIRNSLSMLQKGLPTECGSCTIRDICNEVDGLRELHFGKKTRQREKNPLS